MPRAANAFGHVPLVKSTTNRVRAYAKWHATPQGRLARFLDTLTMEFAMRAAYGVVRKKEKAEPPTAL